MALKPKIIAFNGSSIIFGVYCSQPYGGIRSIQAISRSNDSRSAFLFSMKAETDIPLLLVNRV